jgi:hypothetical protein
LRERERESERERRKKEKEGDSGRQVVLLSSPFLSLLSVRHTLWASAEGTMYAESSGWAAVMSVRSSESLAAAEEGEGGISTGTVERR